MAQSPPAASKNSAATKAAGAARRPLVPPEDSVWKRYSAHHEFPLSVTSSTAVHAVFFVILILGALGLIHWATSKDKEPEFVGDVEIGGGGGNPDGSGTGPGDNPLEGGPKREAGGESDTSKDPPKPTAKGDDITFNPVTVNPEKFDFLVNQPGAEKLLEKPTEQMRRLDGLQQGVIKKLSEGLAASKGKGGSGKGGGKDKGIGTGEGDLAGPGKGNVVNERMKRALRWTMIFNTANGRDYKAQLADLKAIIAIPMPPDGREFMVFRDLKAMRPVGKIEDIGEIKRIYWVDDKRESVQSLSQALGLDLQPPQIVAFFPLELEKKLLKLELARANKKEDQENDILETRFEILRRGGHYEPVVVAQQLAR
jgi:hypothetical protein